MFDDDKDQPYSEAEQKQELLDALMDLVEVLGWTMGYKVDANGVPVLFFAGIDSHVEELLASMPDLIETMPNREEMN